MGDQPVARRPANSRVTTEVILTAALEVLGSHSTAEWTVDQVAAKAGCAKGLVLYHFKSKEALLLQVAERVRGNLESRRITGLGSAKGAAALDRLWTALVSDVKSGEFALWLGLLGDQKTRKAAGRATEEDRRLIAGAAEALGIRPESAALGLIMPALDGFGLALLQGRNESDVREGYDEFWLGVLSEAG